MKKLMYLVMSIAMALFAADASAQYIPVTASSCIVDGSGSTISSGTLIVVGTDSNDNPVVYRAGSTFITTTAPITKTITSGSVPSFQLADPASSSPLNVSYRFVVQDNTTKKITVYKGINITPNDVLSGGVFTTFNICKMNPGAGVASFGGFTTPSLVSGDWTVTRDLIVNRNETIAGSDVITGPLTAAAAKNIGGIQYAAQFAGSSTTCGIAEAYAALPSPGGEIVLQQGNCSASGWPVTIQKPILLVGQGMGGPNDAGTNANVVAGSSLTNTSTASSFFVLSLAAQSSLEGVTFRDFAMIGNKSIGGATAGDCVDINGGTTAQQVRAIKFDNVQCNQPKISGFVIQDGAFIIEFNNTHVDQSGSHCYVLKDGPNSGVNSQIHFIASVADLCGGNSASFLPGTADGWHISGSTSRSVDITDSTLADSANGVNVVTGATGTNVHITNSDFETNTVADVNLNDGYGHTIIGSTLLGSGAATGRGVLTAMPAGANFTQNQLMMFANNISGHATQDVTIGANQHICTILPQAQNNYTFSDASLTCVKIDSDSTGALIIKTLTGILPSTAANGSLGSAAAPWNNSFLFGFQSWNEGTAPSGVTGTEKCYGDSTAHALECSYNAGSFLRIPQVISSGTATMTTAAIASGACGTTVTVAATGVLTTDVIDPGFNAAIGANPGVLIPHAWPTANNVNFNYCNPTAASVTPSAATLNWSVRR